MLDEVPLTTVEEMRLAALADGFGGRRRQFAKCRYPEGGFFYLIVDDNGGYQYDTLDEVREFLEG
jgi:hypothetical protein